MKVEILGTGCAKCKKLYDTVKQIADDNNIDAQIVKVEDLDKILEYSVLSTPALVVDGTVKTTGKIPSNDDIKRFLSGE